MLSRKQKKYIQKFIDGDLLPERKKNMSFPEGENSVDRETNFVISSLLAQIRNSLPRVAANEEAQELLGTMEGMTSDYLDQHAPTEGAERRITLKEYNAQLPPPKGFFKTLVDWI